MAICPFCERYISATLCQKYADHIKVCKRWYDEKLRNSNPPPLHPTTMIHIEQLNIINFEYPRTEASASVLEAAKKLQIERFDTPEKLNECIQNIQDMHDGEILKVLEGSNREAKGNALAFLAEIMSTLNNRLRYERPANADAIKASQDFYDECVKDRRGLVTITEC